MFKSELKKGKTMNLKNKFKLTADGFAALTISLIMLLVALLLANRFNAGVALIFLISVVEVGVLSVACASAIKDFLVSRYFISRGQTRHYSNVNLDSIGILLLAAIGCVAPMTIDVIIFGIAAALIVIFSVLTGRSLAKDEISERTLISEMTEDQKNFRSKVIDESSELLSRQEFERTFALILDLNKRVASIDYCVNYLPIDILTKDLESYKDREDLNLLDKLILIASNRSTERRENAILFNAIRLAQDARLESLEDYRKYFN